MKIRQIGLTGCVGIILAVLPAAAPAQSSGPVEREPDRVCGIEPGDGAYSYVKTWDVDCRTANKVGRRAFKKFCGEEFQDCNAMLGEFDEGRVSAKGWRCEMKVGYEFGRAKCRRDGARFVRKYAA